MILGNPENRGKGLGIDTLMATMRFAFDELELEYLDSDIIESNTSSLRTYTEYCGWKIIET
jgi:RimJ/RimL family protein N-acetyltransferase